MFTYKHIKDKFLLILLIKMSIPKKINNKTKIDPSRIILYILVTSFIISFVSTIVISIILACSSYDLTVPSILPGSDNPKSERVLGQFGPIATVVLLIGIPLLILITTISYAFYISASGIKDKLSIF